MCLSLWPLGAPPRLHLALIVRAIGSPGALSGCLHFDLFNEQEPRGHFALFVCERLLILSQELDEVEVEGVDWTGLNKHVEGLDGECSPN